MPEITNRAPLPSVALTSIVALSWMGPISSRVEALLTVTVSPDARVTWPLAVDPSSVELPLTLMAPVSVPPWMVALFRLRCEPVPRASIVPPWIVAELMSTCESVPLASMVPLELSTVPPEMIRPPAPLASSVPRLVMLVGLRVSPLVPSASMMPPTSFGQRETAPGPDRPGAQMVPVTVEGRACDIAVNVVVPVVAQHNSAADRNSDRARGTIGPEHQNANRCHRSRSGRSWHCPGWNPSGPGLEALPTIAV